MLNVMTIIPFIVCPIVVSSVGYLLMKLHIIAPYIGILGLGSLPHLFMVWSMEALVQVSMNLLQLFYHVLSGIHSLRC